MGNQEITLRIKCSLKEFYEILEKQNFSVCSKFLLNDKYFLPSNLNIKNLSSREILKNAILLRNIYDYTTKEKIYKFTFKRKEFDESGNILNQSSVNCKIYNIEDGEKFLNSIGYSEILQIKEYDVVYKKEELEIAVKDVENGDNLIEIETIKNNNSLDTVEKLEEKILQMNLPIYEDNFFVKKAEIELDKKLYNKL